MTTSTDALKSPEIESFFFFFFFLPKLNILTVLKFRFFFCTWCLCSSLKLMLPKMKRKFCDVRDV